MLAILYWILVVFIGLGHGYVGFGPNGNRIYGGAGLLLVIVLVLIGLRVFPVAL